MEGTADNVATSATEDASSAATEDASGAGAHEASDPVADEPSPDENAGQSCGDSLVPHSFTGSTPVLLADGTSKPIDQIKVGDKIADSVPGQQDTQTHTVQNVIVTTTDHDFVDITIKPNSTHAVAKGSRRPSQGSRSRPPLWRRPWAAR